MFFANVNPPCYYIMAIQASAIGWTAVAVIIPLSIAATPTPENPNLVFALGFSLPLVLGLITLPLVGGDHGAGMDSLSRANGETIAIEAELSGPRCQA